MSELHNLDYSVVFGTLRVNMGFFISLFLLYLDYDVKRGMDFASLEPYWCQPNRAFILQFFVNKNPVCQDEAHVFINQH